MGQLQEFILFDTYQCILIGRRAPLTLKSKLTRLDYKMAFQYKNVRYRVSIQQIGLKSGQQVFYNVCLVLCIFYKSPPSVFVH